MGVAMRFAVLAATLLVAQHAAADEKLDVCLSVMDMMKSQAVAYENIFNYVDWLQKRYNGEHIDADIAKVDAIVEAGMEDARDWMRRIAVVCGVRPQPQSGLPQPQTFVEPPPPPEPTVVRRSVDYIRDHAMRISHIKYTERYATLIVQGTRANVPVQCVLRARTTNDFVASDVWHLMSDVATEVILDMPEGYETRNLEPMCFEVE